MNEEKMAKIKGQRQKHRNFNKLECLRPRKESVAKRENSLHMVGKVYKSRNAKNYHVVSDPRCLLFNYAKYLIVNWKRLNESELEKLLDHLTI